jgi:CubicO group peptidase (beta-lactamase class C family)
MAIVPLSGVRLIARAGSVLESECSGSADRPGAVPWTARTASQIASISKQFVAVVTLMMVERDVFGLDDAVATLLPEAPGRWSAVTLKHLLTHTSGLPHWCELRGFDPAVAVDPNQRLADFLDASLTDEPGAVWRYSSPGYIVLSAVLERASGRSYADLARELIIDDLALTGTTIGTQPTGEFARGYHGGQSVPSWDLLSMPGTGDVWSHAPDVATFVTAVHDGTLLLPRARALLRETSVPLRQTQQEPSPVVTTRYALGHFIGTVHGQDARLHPGDNPGYQALAAWLPATGTVIVLLSNEETDDLEAELAHALTQVM